MTAQREPNDRRIVVGVDGSASSIDALRWAARIGAAIGSEVDAVTAWQFPAGYGFSSPPADWRPDQDAAQVLADAVTSAFGDARPTGLRAVISEGHPTAVLLDASRDAEMLVVGSRGHGGFAGLLLGSVSAHCAEHARCPVVVVHAAAVG